LDIYFVLFSLRAFASNQRLQIDVGNFHTFDRYFKCRDDRVRITHSPCASAYIYFNFIRDFDHDIFDEIVWC